MFIPVKADFVLPRMPVMTVLICLLCVGVFLVQESGWREFETAIERYCAVPRSRLVKMVIKRVQEQQDATICGETMYRIHTSDNPAEKIAAIVGSLKPLSGLSAEDSREYFSRLLNDELRSFRNYVPDDPDSAVAYNTASWNPWHMITASFAHGDWGHILFNLVFFFAFAATVESLIGPIGFVFFIVLNSLIIGATDSIVSTLLDDHHWTLGLSGIVMGMMGLFAYLLPRGKIRCYYWVIVIFGSVAIPGWILAAWYIGGDVYQLFTRDEHGAINVLAHVSGGVAGYLYGFLFLRKARRDASDLQEEVNKTAVNAMFMTSRMHRR